MNFIIITPSYNQRDHLKRCVASVVDQADSCTPTAIRSFSVHHHIQDGRSKDGTDEFLKEHKANGSEPLANSPQPTANGYTFSYESIPDNGMYDALNRGIERTLGERITEDGGQRTEGRGQRIEDSGQRTDNRGQRTEDRGQRAADSGQIAENSQPPTANYDDSIVAWLNCDEQYLPGTLQKVTDFLNRHSEVDILFGGMLMVDGEGELLSCRKAMPMRKVFLEASYLYNFSCAMFFRQSLWERVSGFDTSFKNAADEEWVLRALRQGAKCGVLNEYLSTFLYHEENLSSDPGALLEHERIKRSIPLGKRILRVPFNLVRLAEKFIRGGHVQKTPVEYDIYMDDLKQRTKFRCENSSCKWPGAERPYLVAHRLKG